MITRSMLRLFVVCLVFLLSGCAGSGGYPTVLQKLNYEASKRVGNAWISANPTMRRMHCFPFYCHHNW